MDSCTSCDKNQRDGSVWHGYTYYTILCTLKCMQRNQNVFEYAYIGACRLSKL